MNTVQVHAHRPSGRVHCVATAVEFGARGVVGFVHPNGEAGNPGVGVRDLHLVEDVQPGGCGASTALLYTVRPGSYGKMAAATPGRRRTAAPVAPRAYSAQEATRVSQPRR